VIGGPALAIGSRPARSQPGAGAHQKRTSIPAKAPTPAQPPARVWARSTGERVRRLCLQTILPAQGDLTGTRGLASRRPGARLFLTHSPDSQPELGRAQPKRPFPHADHPITDRPVRSNSTGCETALNFLSLRRAGVHWQSMMDRPAHRGETSSRSIPRDASSRRSIQAAPTRRLIARGRAESAVLERRTPGRTRS